MNIQVWLLVLLICVPVTYASKYNFTVTYDIDDELQTGEYDFGNIIFNPKIDSKQLVVLNESVDYTITREDSIQNKYNFSIIVGNDIVVKNEILKLTSVGQKEIRKLSDNSRLGYLFVHDITPLSFSLASDDTLFDLYFSDSTIKIDDLNEQNINVSVNYSVRTQPGEYDIDLVYDYDDYEVRDEISFELLPLRNFTVEIVNCTKEMAILDSGVFCEFTIENTGNILLDIKGSIEGQSKYFHFPENIGSFPGDRRQVLIYYDLSVDPPTVKNYTYNITFDSDGKKVDIPINFSFVDRIFPYFKNFSMNDTETYRVYEDTVEVIENYNLTYVKARLYRDGVNTWELVDEWDLPKIRFNLYELQFTPKIEGDYKLELWARDVAENINISEWKFYVHKLDAIQDANNIKFKKVKENIYTYTPLFYVEQDMEVAFKVVNLNYDNCSDWEIAIKNSDTGDERFIRAFNSEAVFRKKGNYSIGFKGGCLSDLYNGQISVDVPQYHQPIDNIIFSGQVINYTIPEEIVEKDWNGGTLQCNTQDTGDIETSSYRCTVEYPLTLNKVDIIPVSVDSYDQTMEQYDFEIDEWKDKNNTKAGIITMLIITIILLILSGVYFFYLYPILKIRLN